MEDIKLLVQEEGRSARNLVTFNVPVIEVQCDSQGKLFRKPPTSQCSFLQHSKKNDTLKYYKRSRESSQSGSRVRSASTGRDKKSELHARYWAFLFGNLQRAVDEIYQTCETDESVTECKEVIMVLDNYTREFKNLINWFKIKWDYETTPPPQRPHSLAWEIRKSSPGKMTQKLFEPIFGDSKKSISLLMKPSDLNSNSNSIEEEKKAEESNVDINDENLSTIDQTLLEAKEIKNSIQPSKITSQIVCHQDSISLKNSSIDAFSTTTTPCVENGTNEIQISFPKNVISNKSDTGDNVCQKNPDIECNFMTDEICQTDPEKDVDENGPKFRSSSQQTCSIITGFNIEDFQNNHNSKENIQKKDITGADLAKTTVKEILSPKDEIKATSKPVPSVQANRILMPHNSQNTTSGRTLVKNSYSQVATTQSKSVNIQMPIKTNSPISTSNPSSRVKTYSTTAPRQPWDSRSTHRRILSNTIPKSPVLNKLTRSKTVDEVRRPEKNASVLKSTKIMSCSNKVSKESKSISINESKVNSPYSINNSNSMNVVGNPLSSVIYQETSGSVEVLTTPTKECEDDDGWVKVRSKSRFSPATKTGDLETTLSQSASNLKTKDHKVEVRMNHKTRFHQPSSAVSLPTLTFSSGECKENIGSRKLIKSKSDAKREKLREKKIEKGKVEEILIGGNNANKKKNNGEKLRKNSNRLQTERNLNEANKEKEDLQFTKAEKADHHKNLIYPGKRSKEPTKSVTIDQDAIDDEENNFHEEIKKNKETEERLQKEINELEATEIELETGDEETDGENTTTIDEERNQKKTLTSTKEETEKKVSPKKMHRYQEILSGMSWADHMDTLDELEKLVVQDCSKKGMTKDEQMDTLERLEEFVARHPGRALELHQKLSSPSRRRTMLETVKKFQARQAKALEKREQLKFEKAQKLRELLKKVDEVKAAKDKLIENRRQRLEMKLKRAAENRNLHLREIMRKAHDEEEKLKEIAFINELEAQNKRHDFITQCQEQEGRLQGIHEERQRKQEEKAAKEAAVEERRKAIEAERQEKLEKMQEKQRKRDEQADKKKQEKEKERQELAREKARDRSERLEALHAAQLEAQEELQKKILQKQEDYARRHEENIEQIRQKALELSISKCSDDVAPRMIPYETQKLCTACNVLIGSEVYLLSHLRGKKHQEMVKIQVNGKDLTKEEIERHNVEIIVNAPSDKIDPKIELDKERIKNFNKKCKKLRTRMISKGEEYLSKKNEIRKVDCPAKNKLQKCLKDIEKVIISQGKGQWSDTAITTLERSMGEINRTLSKHDRKDQLVFRVLNGFTTLNTILQLDLDVPQNMTPYLPQKCFVTTSMAYLAAITESPDNCKFVILSNKIIVLLDVLLKRLTIMIPDHITGGVIQNSKSFSVDLLASVVMRVIAKILMNWEETQEQPEVSVQHEEFLPRLQDIISYTVSVGIVDKLTRYCKSIRDPIENNMPASQFLLSTVELLTTLTTRCKTVRQGNEDPTQLLATLEVTELVGAVSILYGMLLHQGAPPRLIDATPPSLPSQTIEVTLGTIRLLRSVAELDLQMFQSILGAEGISLQFRHIASYLLWYCCHGREKVLLHEVVVVVGYFAVQHRDNQMILQSGSMPTVLQQLCNLPFPYFSNPELSAILFPTLLACCSNNEENKGILEQEISYSLLEDFIESEAAVNHPLIPLIRTR